MWNTSGPSYQNCGRSNTWPAKLEELSPFGVLGQENAETSPSRAATCYTKWRGQGVIAARCHESGRATGTRGGWDIVEG